MNNEFNDGYQRAVNGGFRAMPKEIKIVSQESKDWYAGYDSATEKNLNPKLTRKFRLRK